MTVKKVTLSIFSILGVVCSLNSYAATYFDICLENDWPIPRQICMYGCHTPCTSTVTLFSGLSNTMFVEKGALVSICDGSGGFKGSGTIINSAGLYKAQVGSDGSWSAAYTGQGCG